MALLFDRSGGQITKKMSEVIEKVEVSDKFHQHMIRQVDCVHLGCCHHPAGGGSEVTPVRSHQSEDTVRPSPCQTCPDIIIIIIIIIITIIIVIIIIIIT